MQLHGQTLRCFVLSQSQHFFVIPTIYVSRILFVRLRRKCYGLELEWHQSAPATDSEVSSNIWNCIGAVVG